MPLIKPPNADPTLEPFEGGVGTLSQHGEIKGHVATTRSTFWSPSSPLRMQWWIWYFLVWEDGTRERSTEDYPPFTAVNEMTNGYLEVEGTARDGRYDFSWLSDEDAASVRTQNNITDADF